MRHYRDDMQPGDVLACYTDGLIEAQDGGKGFGVARLDAAVREAAPRGAEAVKCHVLEAFDRFLAGKNAEDDVTLVVVGVKDEAGIERGAACVIPLN